MKSDSGALEPYLVSVIIPTHDRPELLARSLRSVLSQTYKNLEVIVVDDDTKTDLLQIVESFNDHRIKFIKLKEKSGAPKARNVGLAAASGYFIAFQDDDDEWYPDKISAQMDDLAKKDWKYKISYCLGEVQDYSNGTIIIFSKNGWDGPHLEQLISGEIRPCAICFLIARECLDKVGGWRQDLPRMQDRELWIRLAQHYEFAFLNRVLARIHIGHGPRISDNFANRMEAQRKIYLAHRQLFWKHRKALSGYFLNWGFELLDNGYRYQAMELFIKAAIAWPFKHQTYIALLLALKGKGEK